VLAKGDRPCLVIALVSGEFWCRVRGHHVHDPEKIPWLGSNLPISNVPGHRDYSLNGDDRREVDPEYFSPGKPADHLEPAPWCSYKCHDIDRPPDSIVTVLDPEQSVGCT